MDAATRDKQTDSDIFALGEAASRLDDIDDVLAGFGADFSELFNADGGSITTTTCRLGALSHGGPAGRRRGENQLTMTTPVGDLSDTYNTIQVDIWSSADYRALFLVTAWYSPGHGFKVKLIMDNYASVFRAIKLYNCATSACCFF